MGILNCAFTAIAASVSMMLILSYVIAISAIGATISVGSVYTWLELFS